MNHIEISVPNAVIDKDCELKLKMRSMSDAYHNILEVWITLFARVDGEFFLDGNEIVEQTLVLNGKPEEVTP